MKQLLFAFIFLFSLSLAAQDTIYYRFYKGIQMIEIRPEILKSGSYRDITRENEGKQPSIYLFRNEKGQVIQQFNTFGKEVMFAGLKSPVKVPLWKHREKDPDHTKAKHRYAFPGTTGYYLVSNHTQVNGRVLGIIDSLGNIILPIEYSALTKTDSAIIYMKNGKCGLMDLQFKTVAPAQYDNIKRVHTSTPYYDVLWDGHWGMMNRKGKIVLPCVYDRVYASVYDPGYFGVEQNGKWGVADMKGNLVLPCKYDGPFMFMSTSYAKPRVNGLYGYIDSTVKEICPPIYIWLDILHHHVRAQDANGYVFMNRKTGKILCRSKREIVSQINANRFVVKENNQFGIIDSTDKTIEPTWHDDIYVLGNNLVQVALDGKKEGSYYEDDAKWVLMDADGERISKTYSEIRTLNCGLLQVERKHKRGIMNKKGEVLLPLEYDYVNNWGYKAIYFRKGNKHYVVEPDKMNLETAFEAEPAFRGGMAKIMINDRFGYLDSTGKVAIPVQYRGATSFCRGIAGVMKKDKWTLINKKGQPVVEGEFDHVQEFSDRYLVVIRNKIKYLVMGLKEKLVPMSYDELMPQYDQPDFIRVNKGEKHGVVKKTGEVIVPVEYEKINFTSGLIWVNNNGKAGFYDRQGKMLIPPVYEAVVPAYDYQVKFFWAKQNGKWGVLDKNNQIVHPFIFEYMPSYSHREYLHFSESYLAELNITRRHEIEYWYMNIDGEIVGKRKVENRTKGFKTIQKFNRPALYGFVNWEGDTIVPIRHHHISPLEDDHFKVKNDKHMGLMDTTGKWVVPCLYDQVERVGKTKLLKAKRENKWSVYHINGNMLHDTYFNAVGELAANLVQFSRGGEWKELGYDSHYINSKVGIMDSSGKIILEAEYDYIWVMDVKEGLMVCKKGEEMCVMDKTGTMRGGFRPTTTAAARWKLFQDK